MHTSAISRTAALFLLTTAAHTALAVDYSRLTLQPVATGLSAPVSLANPAGDDRLFVLQRNGIVKIVKDGHVQPTPFADISSITVTPSPANERGASTLAFDPNFSSNGRFYISYLDNTTNRMTVRRFTADRNSDTANPTSEVIYTTNAGLASPDLHFSGWLGFRPGEPNNLYVGVGDNSVYPFAASPNSGLGQIARLDVSGSGPATPAANNPFPDNPYVWGYGFRNPFRNSFDRLTGDFYIADVGNYDVEEIDIQRTGAPAGRFFGWPNFEGNIPGPTTITGPNTDNPVPPAFTYNHRDPNLGIQLTDTVYSGCVIGGYVYRGLKIPELYGSYLFADFSRGAIALIPDPSTDTWSNPVLLTNQLNPNNSLFGNFALASFAEDNQGELYALNMTTGTIYKFVTFAVVPEPTTPATLLVTTALSLTHRRRREAP
jgi:glucose/arabinose dehydrogenase